MALQQLPLLPPTSGTERWRRLAEALNGLIQAVAGLVGGGGSGVAAAGTYTPAFLAGTIQYCGPGNVLAAAGDFQVGFLWPNASGVPSAGLFIGGAGKTQIVYITDEQLPGQKGITVIREAGDASATLPATDDGGDLLDFAGGTLHGNGGTAKYQGGTSVSLRGGDSILHGGNSTTGTPGNAVIMGGETGTAAGSSTLLFMIKPTGAPGFGDVRIVKGDGGGPPGGTTTILIQFLDNGEIYLTSSGTGAGLAGQPMVSGGIGAPAKWLSTGFTGTITTAKLTGGGANGSMTFASGILTAQTPAT